MMFDPKIDTKTLQNRPQGGLKELHVLSSISTSIMYHFYLHFGPLCEPFWDLKIALKSTLIFSENELAAT